MPRPNVIVAVSFSKSQQPKFDYFLSRFVEKYQGQYEIHYFSDVWGPEFREQVALIDPILLVHNGHGYSVAWLCQPPDSYPIEDFTAMHYMHSDLMVGRVGIAHACHTANSIGGRWGVAGISYFGYDDESYTINPETDYNSPYLDDWYWMENGINDYFCQGGHSMGESFAFQMDEFDRLIAKWSSERPNEYWTRYVGYASQMKARSKIFGNPSIRLDGTYEECSPDGDTKCIYYDLYECQNGQWEIIEQNSPTCGYVPECSPDGSTKCIGYDLYTCIDGQWILTETNSPSCGYEPECSPEGITKCVVYDLYQCQNGRWVLIELYSEECGFTPPSDEWKKWLTIFGITMGFVGLGIIVSRK